MKTFDLHTDFGDFKVGIDTDTYCFNGALAISLIDMEEGELFDTISVCLEDGLTSYYNYKEHTAYVYIDVNNCPWAIDFIENNELGRPTYDYGFSGFCSYPLYEIFVDKLK